MIQRTVTAFILTAILFAGIGCVSFPYHRSIDRHNFVSTATLPITIQAINSLNGEIEWEKVVPINKQLVLDINDDGGSNASQSGSLPGKSIRWDIFDADERIDILRNKVRLSGDPIYLKVVRTAANANVPMARSGDAIEIKSVDTPPADEADAENASESASEESSNEEPDHGDVPDK